MLKLDFKKKHFFTYKINKDESLVLVPGINDVDEKIWEKCKVNGSLAKEIQIFFDKNLLNFVGGEPKKAEAVGKVEDSKKQDAQSAADKAAEELKQKLDKKKKSEK